MTCIGGLLDTVTGSVILTADEVKEVEGHIDQLQAENAQLRKLGGFMLRCMSQYHDCCDCLVNGEHCDITYIESDAQELGVEVDG
jgi:hypothetical protein